MHHRSWFALAVVFAVSPGCEEKRTEAPAVAPSGAAAAPSGAAAAPSGAAAKPTTADTTAPKSGPSGDLKGHVSVKGKIPVMEDLKRNSDAFCAKKAMKDESVVADAKGNLANVVVHINGLPSTPAPSQKVTLSQDDCTYKPHVLGIVDGQPLDIRNGDPILHNVHSYEGARTLFNVAQVPGTPNYEKTFADKNGVMIKLKCDIHQWMTAYVWVQNNHFFAVTDKDGTFAIKDVPVGTYDIEAWHERFGTKTGKVTVAKDKPAEVKFEFVGTETAAK
jgi:hypothetical protein